MKYESKDTEQHISLLLGSGFSVVGGFPTANSLNNKLEYFDSYYPNSFFAPNGRLGYFNSQRIKGSDYSNPFQRCYTLCRKLIAKYKENKNIFDYEEFYDFIRGNKGDEIYSMEYEQLSTDLVNHYQEEKYSDLVNLLPIIFEQMVSCIINHPPQKCHDIEMGYDGFIQWISRLSEDYIIDIHTLNHDLLFESFRVVPCLKNKISDGYCEINSPFYGVSMNNPQEYIRLERYTGEYLTPIRLYKLHGSFNYYPYYGHVERNLIYNYENHVKLNAKVCPDRIIKKESGSETKYEEYPFNYHAEFMTGKTWKQDKYKSRFYNNLFELFKGNLRLAHKLIIIGYGCKDPGINEIIRNYFDWRNKQVYIIDKCNDGRCNKDVEDFRKDINAHIYMSGIERFEEYDFCKKQVL